MVSLYRFGFIISLEMLWHCADTGIGNGKKNDHPGFALKQAELCRKVLESLGQSV